MKPLASIGRPVLAALAAVGRMAIFAGETVSHLARPPWYPREFLIQMLHIGYFSLPVVGLTTIFTGGALALQIYAGGARFSAEAVVPQIVAIGMVRELGPVLVGVGDVIGIMGGYIGGVERLGFNAATYLRNTVDFLEALDIVSSLTKGAVFGFIAALMGCFFGMRSERGAAGVGAATKGAVVAASVLILAANFILTELFFAA
ncbi:MAG: ABC transporter permease [Silicimonas sp.]|nr:ABC transporter permease [Silicimonas sp.]